MDAWHHRLNERGFEQTPGAGDGQGGLVCCSPWGCKELDTNEGLNYNNSSIPSRWESLSGSIPSSQRTFLNISYSAGGEFSASP